MCTGTGRKTDMTELCVMGFSIPEETVNLIVDKKETPKALYFMLNQSKCYFHLFLLSVTLATSVCVCVGEIIRTRKLRIFS